MPPAPVSHGACSTARSSPAMPPSATSCGWRRRRTSTASASSRSYRRRRSRTAPTCSSCCRRRRRSSPSSSNGRPAAGATIAVPDGRVRDRPEGGRRGDRRDDRGDRCRRRRRSIEAIAVGRGDRGDRGDRGRQDRSPGGRRAQRGSPAPSSALHAAARDPATAQAEAAARRQAAPHRCARLAGRRAAGGRRAGRCRVSAAVRQRLREDNARLRAEGKPEMPEAAVLKMAEELIPRLRVADWLDRAEAAQRQLEHLDLRDLRSVVASADDPVVARDESTRELAAELKQALITKQDEELALWLTDVEAALDVGRVVRGAAALVGAAEGRRAVPGRAGRSASARRRPRRCSRPTAPTAGSPCWRPPRSRRCGRSSRRRRRPSSAATSCWPRCAGWGRCCRRSRRSTTSRCLPAARCRSRCARRRGVPRPRRRRPITQPVALTLPTRRRRAPCRRRAAGRRSVDPGAAGGCGTGRGRRGFGRSVADHGTDRRRREHAGAAADDAADETPPGTEERAWSTTCRCPTPPPTASRRSPSGRPPTRATFAPKPNPAPPPTAGMRPAEADESAVTEWTTADEGDAAPRSRSRAPTSRESTTCRCPRPPPRTSRRSPSGPPPTTGRPGRPRHRLAAGPQLARRLRRPHRAARLPPRRPRLL